MPPQPGSCRSNNSILSTAGAAARCIHLHAAHTHVLLKQQSSCRAYIAPRRANFTCVDLGCEPQRAEALWGILWCRADVHKHQCLGVTPQAGLQQPRQLAVAVRDVGFFVGQRHNHITCTGQGKPFVKRSSAYLDSTPGPYCLWDVALPLTARNSQRALHTCVPTACRMSSSLSTTLSGLKGESQNCTSLLQHVGSVPKCSMHALQYFWGHCWQVVLTQCAEALVDGLCLLQPLALRSTLLHTLRASQVNQVQHARHLQHKRRNATALSCITIYRTPSTWAA